MSNSLLTAKSIPREFDIDPFRGFVCLCLIFLHYYILNADYWQRIGGSTLEYIIWNIRLGVESFFILAGFMMAHMLRPVLGEAVSIRLYVKRRFFRLIIPLWAAVLLATADKWLIGTVFKSGKHLPGVWEVFSQFTLTHEFFKLPEAATGLLSMVTLEQFYLIWLAFFAVVRWLIPPSKIASHYGRADWVMALLTLVGCIASAVLVIYANREMPATAAGKPIVNTLPPHHPNGLHWDMCYHAVYLTLGMLLYWAIRRCYVRWMFVLGIAALIVTAAMTGDSHPMKGLITVAIFIPLARGRRLPHVWPVRALRYVGMRSYSFYLMHAIVGQRVFSLASFLGNRGDWVAFPLLAVALVAMFFVSLVFYKFVEVPCREMARKVQFRRIKPLAT